MNKQELEPIYSLSTRPALASDYKERWAWYISGPGCGGYHGGFYGSQFNLRIFDGAQDPEQPEWWSTLIIFMNHAYEQGRQVERKYIRESITGALGIK